MGRLFPLSLGRRTLAWLDDRADRCCTESKNARVSAMVYLNFAFAASRAAPLCAGSETCGSVSANGKEVKVKTRNYEMGFLGGRDEAKMERPRGEESQLCTH